MPDRRVSFDTDAEIRRPSPYRERKSSAMVNLLLKMGIAKDERSAQVFLVGIITVCLLLTAAMYFLGSQEEALPELTPEQQLHEL